MPLEIKKKSGMKTSRQNKINTERKGRKKVNKY
jgi:hypothetical protein